MHLMFNGPFTLGATHGRQVEVPHPPPVWATATCASDGHPVIDEVAIAVTPAHAT